MVLKPDWVALEKLFDPSDTDLVMCLGEVVPRWLVYDLMEERAAIREFDGGMTRTEAETATILEFEMMPPSSFFFKT